MLLLNCGVHVSALVKSFEGALRINSNTVNPGRAPRNASHLWCRWYPSILQVHAPSHLSIGMEVGALVHRFAYRGLAARRSFLVPTLVGSGSVLSGLPQSSMPTCTLQFFLLLEPFTAVFCICCGTVIRGCLVGHVYWSICLSSGSPQHRPHVSISVGPFWAAWNHNPTRTAFIFVWVDSFIQVLTAKHRMLNPSPVTRSHHTPHSLVTAWLLQQEWLTNPSSLRWSPHLVPISHTSH